MNTKVDEKNDTSYYLRKEYECENWQLGEIKLRYAMEQQPVHTIECPQDSVKIVIDSIDTEELQIQESFYCIFMNRQHQAIGFRTITTGQIAKVDVTLRLILSIALIINAESIVVMHNHPSGNLTPSNGDVTFTEQLIRTAKLLNIEVLDHIILTKGYFLSMRWSKYVDFENARDYSFPPTVLDGPFSWPANPIKKRGRKKQTV